MFSLFGRLRLNWRFLLHRLRGFHLFVLLVFAFHLLDFRLYVGLDLDVIIETTLCEDAPEDLLFLLFELLQSDGDICQFLLCFGVLRVMLQQLLEIDLNN